MGQQEVYDFLVEHKSEWFTSRDISESLNVSIGSVTMSLKKLRKTNLLSYKNTGKRNTFIYCVEEKKKVQAAPKPAEKKKTVAKKKPAEKKVVKKTVAPKKKAVQKKATDKKHVTKKPTKRK
ncbi:MAG: hypothetical protein H6502_04850 [Candidatus Woesearchaeota archaeon]|nr:MAG: hypothetical protein H6502_04850 [Candidatus Woesearchaeota archaeon]